MSNTAYIAKPVLTPQDAIASHVRWKIALLLAAQMREPLSERATRSLTHPQECAIHKWLLSPHAEHLRGLPQYRAALELHATFHAHMLQVANLLRAGHFDQALLLINQPRTAFQEASNALANAIMALERQTRPARR